MKMERFFRAATGFLAGAAIYSIISGKPVDGVFNLPAAIVFGLLSAWYGQ